MPMNTRRTVFALPLVAALAACGPSEPPQSDAPPVADAPVAPAASDAPEPAAGAAAAAAAVPQVLQAGQSWTLVDANDAGLKSVAEAAGIFIEVQDTRLVGYAGCNRFSAAMQRGKDSAITLEAPVASKRACMADALNAAEQSFLRALPAVQSFELSADRLRLQGADGLLLEFAPGRPGSADGDASQAEGT